MQDELHMVKTTYTVTSTTSYGLGVLGKYSSVLKLGNLSRETALVSCLPAAVSKVNYLSKAPWLRFFCLLFAAVFLMCKGIQGNQEYIYIMCMYMCVCTHVHMYQSQLRQLKHKYAVGVGFFLAVAVEPVTQSIKHLELLW